MAWTDAETKRVLALEKVANKLQTAINGLAAKETVRKLMLIRQEEIDDLTTRVAALEAQVAILQND